MVVTTGIVVIALVWICKKIYNYMYDGFDIFDKYGLPYIKPTPMVGSTYKLLARKVTTREYFWEVYNQYPNAPVVGLYDRKKPVFMIRDPELIKQLGVKDFDHFCDHNTMIDDKKEPLFAFNLVNLKGNHWRDMRATLSPVFTGSKMKQMFELVSEIGAQMAEHFKNQTQKDRIVEFKNICSRYTNDVIATSAFGIQVDSLSNEKNEFFLSAKSLLDFSGFLTQIKFFFLVVFPDLAKKIGISFVPEWKTKFFRTLITEAMDTRERENIFRPDMINLMIQLKKGALKMDDRNDDKNEGFATVQETDLGRVVVRRKWTDNELMAQCFIFFMAGFETSSTAMSFMAYELAINQDVQKKLIEEIDQTNEELGGKRLTYDALCKMKYLDCAMTESLRYSPPAEITDRKCVKDYRMVNSQGEEYYIKKDEVIWFPIVGLHYDQKYFENPKKFYPDRFNDENKHKINQGAYLPFGVGPRNCIGSRFALMEIKCAFYYLLLNFTLEICEKTQVPIQLKKGFGLLPEKGIWLELKPRKH